MNLTLDEYQHASDPEIEALINYIERARPDLRFDSFLTNSPYQLPRFKFSRLKHLYFIYVPGGTFKMGLSEAEEWAAREISDPPLMNIGEMRPVTELEVDGFLVAEVPFLARHAWCMEAYVRELQPVLIDCIEHLPDLTYYCGFNIAQAVATELNACLPREYQREYFCRGNTNTLFCFGNSLPDGEELNKWFNYGFGEGMNTKRNNFGIGGLFISEWCDDLFSRDYSSGKVATHTRVCRGGGADFCHWRNEKDWDPLDKDDWVWCASAMRMPSTYLKNDIAGFRFVINLDNRNCNK